MGQRWRRAGRQGCFCIQPPVGAPTVTCIAANKYVAQNGGGVRYVSNLSIFNGPNRMRTADISDLENANENQKSLGFWGEFNKFRAYIAGDLEWVQEDGVGNPNTFPAVFQPGVRALLNNADTMAGRVLVIKPSHHGSETATSRVFATQMRPSAGLISNGTGNQFRHPAQRTVNVLDGYPQIPILPDAANQNRHPDPPPPPPFPPIKYYLTGYYDIVNHLTYGEDASETAGDPPNHAGHIRLDVTLAHSQVAVEGQVYRGVGAAATQTANAPGVNIVVNAATIAEEAATYGTAAAVAAAVGATRPMAFAALDALAWMGAKNGVGVIQAAMAQVANGAGAVAFAATGVADNAVGRTTHVGNNGNGVPAAIGAAMTGATAANISLAGHGAGASQNASDAAGFAAVEVRARNAVDDAGYTVAAAIAAVHAGATVAQAAAIAAALGSTVAVATVQNTADATTAAAIAAGMPAGLAAVAGAVAGACYYLGVPADVGTAVQTALAQSGFAPPVPANAGALATATATIANPDQFTVQAWFWTGGVPAAAQHTLSHF